MEHIRWEALTRANRGDLSPMSVHIEKKMYKDRIRGYEVNL